LLGVLKVCWQYRIVNKNWFASYKKLSMKTSSLVTQNH
jgi:hypothetical protein